MLTLPLPVALAVWLMLLAGSGVLASFRMLGGLSLLERLVFRVVLGMAVAPTIVILLFELFRLPYHLVTIVVVGCAGLALWWFEGRGAASAEAESRERADHHRTGADALVVLVVAAAVFATCWMGADRPPLFGGRDSWGHALGVAALIDDGDLRQHDSEWPVIHYVDGYPPLYDVLMAFPCELAGSVQRPFKAAHAVLVGIGGAALWLLCLWLTRNADCAVLAMLLYAALPGNLTRQAWGHAAAVLFLLVGLACAARLRHRSAWILPASLLFGGALLAAPTQGIKAGMLLALTAAVALPVDRRWSLRLVAAGIAALLVAGVWFGPLVFRTGISPSALVDSMDHPELRRSGQRWKVGADPAAGLEAALQGSHHRRYTLDDLLFFRPHLILDSWRGTKIINNMVPEGLGIPVASLAALFLLSGVWRWPTTSRWPGWRRPAAAWVLLVALGLLGPVTGLSFYVWRWWLLLCPLACLAAAGMVVDLVEHGGGSRRARWAAGIIAGMTGVQLVLAGVTDLQSGAWRFWLFGPPLAAVVAAAAWWLVRAGRRWSSVAGATGLILVAVCGAHIVIAAPARVRALTVFVDPLVFTDRIEGQGYLKMLELTRSGEAVLPLSQGNRAEVVIGLGRWCRPWRTAEIELARELTSGCPPAASELVARARSMGYRYLVLDPSLRAGFDVACDEEGVFKRLAIGLAETPGAALVASHPAPDIASTSRWVLYRLDQVAGAGDHHSDGARN